MSKKNTYLKSSQSMADMNELSDLRIIRKNLVYVIGLSHTIASSDKLISQEYFGQYGHITKMVVNKKKPYNTNSPNGPSYSAYVTYQYPHEASLAILSVDNTMINNTLIRASFGTTKYCSFFLKRIECTNKDCLFLHRKANESDIIKKEDLNVNKSIFYQQQLYAIKIANVYNPEVKQSIINAAKNKRKTVLPSPDLIYKNHIVIENDPSSKETQTKIKKLYREDLHSVSKAEKGDLEKGSITQKENNSNTSRNKENQLNNNVDKDEITCASTGDEKGNVKEIGGKMFISKDKSRFEFTNDKEQYSTIPQFVLDLVNKKYQLDMYGKSMRNKDRLLLLNPSFKKEVKHNNPWAEFIMSNNIDNQYNSNNTHNKTSVNKEDKEFIDEFENINHFILKQINM